MAKFLKIKVQNTLVKSTTSAANSTAADLIDSAANFTTAGVAAGDIVYNTTDGSTHVVDTVVDATHLTLVTGTVGNSKAYMILDASAYTYEYVSAENVKYVDEKDTVDITTDIYYGTGSTGTDVITIAHQELSDNFDMSMKTAIQDALEAANKSNWQNVTEEVVLPTDILALNVTIG